MRKEKNKILYKTKIIYFKIKFYNYLKEFKI